MLKKKELNVVLKTKKEIRQTIKNVLLSGNWMIRTDENGSSYNGFKWEPLGYWTECPDWKPNNDCGNGLHGQSRKHGGFNTGNKRLVFCETYGRQYPIPKFKGDKVKVRYARILMIGSLPNGIKFDDDLNLSQTEITSLPENLSVGGSLYLRGTKILDKDIPKHLKKRVVR